jgi:hypothetical protein
MLALKRAMILGIAVFLIVWAGLLSIGQVVGASGALSPTLVSPANNSWVTENKPTFIWRAPGNNQSGFNLQINTTTVLVQDIILKSSIQNYTLTTNEALSDGMYYWRVKTNDTSGVWSDWSAVWLVKVDTTKPSPVTVSSPRTSTKLTSGLFEIGGGESVEINWTASNDPYFGRYELYISTNPAVLGTKNATITSVGSTSYTLEVGEKGLKAGTTYYFSVVVVDQAGLSSEAAKTSVTTTAPMNWPLMGGVAVAVELVIGVIFVVFELFIKKK